MFYLRYLWAELTRRWSKTLMITLGLAMASAIIIVIISVSESLSSAQDKVLNPLQNVGTDILVSRTLNRENTEGLDETTRSEMMSENRINMDLSALGDPGEEFSTDTFLPGSLLTFDAAEAAELDGNLVKEVATGLIMNVMHQSGTVPDVSVDVQAGGETFEVNQEIDPMTDAERTASDAARTKAMDEMKTKGIDPQSEEGREYLRNVMDESMPDRFQNMQFRFTAPERTITQQVGPIETSIDTASLTVAGVDTTKTDIGLILPDQVTDGTYFTGGADEVVINQSYADKNSVKVGDKVTLSGKELSVVGIVQPKLYTNTADLYLPLTDLQTLAGRTDRINIMLIKATDAQSVDDTSTQLESAFAGATVTDSQDTAEEVTGSLVSATNLTNKFIGLTSAIVVIAAFVIVSLLTILSVNKRIREIGTLKAVGWKNGLIVRQIIAENIVLGILGAAIGIGLAIGIVAILNHYDISLSATIAGQEVGFGFGGRGGFMGREAANSGTTTDVQLTITYSYLVLILGSLVAIVGSILAGTLAAIKSSKMRPQEALRNIE